MAKKKKRTNSDSRNKTKKTTTKTTENKDWAKWRPLKHLENKHIIWAYWLLQRNQYGDIMERFENCCHATGHQRPLQTNCLLWPSTPPLYNLSWHPMCVCVFVTRHRINILINLR
jgi:hypothetical protein